MKPADRQRIVDECLHGHAVFGSLELLWDRQAEADPALSELFQIEQLLTDRRPLDSGYGKAIASESAQNAANVRAHHTLFEQLGFFAEIEDGAFLAYWLCSDAAEPPIVKLDNEGQYSWEGENLAEALFRLAEDGTEGEAARLWLAERGLELAPMGELGVTTQFLPDLSDLQAGLFYANLGQPRLQREPGAAPADARDPTSWLLRPGLEVRAAMTELFGTAPTRFCIWCQGDGLVKQVLLTDEAPAGVSVLGIAIGAAQGEVEQLLGPPTKATSRSIRYERDDRTFVYRLNAEATVESISLGLAKIG
jgi:hypothetical protein